MFYDNTISENREYGSFIWENYYDEETGINEYALTLFLPEDKDLYRKYEEFHYQKAYEIPEVIRLLQEAGLEFVTVYDAFTHEAPGEESQRVYLIARECQKNKKEENV